MVKKNIYKLKESVDVYTYPSKKDNIVNVQFYKINTREKSVIKISNDFLPILSSLDGITPLSTILSNLNLAINNDELEELFGYLNSCGYLKNNRTISHVTTEDKERYSRQLYYFEDLIPNKDAEKLQRDLLTKRVVIIGVGATGGSIAAQLVRAGVRKYTLVDPKVLISSNKVRHIYATNNNLGLYKVEALKQYLTKIDRNCEINYIKAKITPLTDLSKIIPENTDIVINTADEPYIGHITIKLGRYLWDKNIALYVSGGFDAHLMSSGELIHQQLSPCADCCSQSFKKALSDWKPKYAPLREMKSSIHIEKSASYIIGGNGGVFPQSLYSASCATMNIIDFFLEKKQKSNNINVRGEYLINKGETTWFEMKKQRGCVNCGLS